MFKKLLKYFFIALFFVVSELTFNIFSNIISGSQPIKEFVHKAEVYLGFSILEQKALIDSFHATKPTYSVNEPIKFELTLKENAFVYLLCISPTNSSLVFPNSQDGNNNYQAKQRYKLPSRTYKVYANKVEKEKFYLVASSTELTLDEFNTLSVTEAEERVQKLEKSNVVDVYRRDVEVE